MKVSASWTFCPGKFGSYNNFVRRFCNAQQNQPKQHRIVMDCAMNMELLQTMWKRRGEHCFQHKWCFKPQWALPSPKTTCNDTVTQGERWVLNSRPCRLHCGMANSPGRRQFTEHKKCFDHSTNPNNTQHTFCPGKFGSLNNFIPFFWLHYLIPTLYSVL